MNDRFDIISEELLNGCGYNAIGAESMYNFLGVCFPGNWGDKCRDRREGRQEYRDAKRDSKIDTLQLSSLPLKDQKIIEDYLTTPEKKISTGIQVLIGISAASVIGIIAVIFVKNINKNKSIAVPSLLAA